MTEIVHINRQKLLEILETSSCTLHRYIKKYNKELKILNYNRYQRNFTRAQVNFLHAIFWGENYFPDKVATPH